MTLVDAPLVPPGRLAALLISRRSERGLGVVELSALSNGAFSPSYLDAVERGAAQLDDASLQAIVSLYELEAGPIVPDRSSLLLDLEGGLVGVGDTSLTLPSATGRDVLERYVSLLYLLRGESPGKKLTLREEDLQVLEHSLGHDQQRLADELFAIMGENATEQRTSLLGKRTVVLGAGLLVGATTVGALVIVGSGATHDAVEAASPARTEVVSSQTSVSAINATFAVSSGTPGANAVSTTPMSGRGVRVIQTSSTETVEPAVVAPVDVDAAIDDPSAVSVVRAVDGGVTGNGSGTGEGSITASSEPALAVEAEVRVAEIVIPQAEPAAAPAATATAGSPAQIGAAAEALVSYDFRAALPGWSISYAGDSVQFRGLTNSRHKTIVVYVEPGDTSHSVAEVLMHEVGHAIDLDYLDDSTRREWIELRNMPSVWWAGDGLSDFAVGAGDFAEAVAAVTTGSASNSVYGGFSVEQLSFARAQLP